VLKNLRMTKHPAIRLTVLKSVIDPFWMLEHVIISSQEYHFNVIAYYQNGNHIEPSEQQLQ